MLKVNEFLLICAMSLTAILTLSGCEKAQSEQSDEISYEDVVQSVEQRKLRCANVNAQQLSETILGNLEIAECAFSEGEQELGIRVTSYAFYLSKTTGKELPLPLTYEVLLNVAPMELKCALESNLEWSDRTQLLSNRQMTVLKNIQGVCEMLPQIRSQERTK